MEPHAVPQNILDVEFKLFGSFTFKQFIKMLLGSLIALMIFLVNMPWLVKLPLMGVSVVTGIALAIIPNFGVWLKGYAKAIFISPRYVWVKETKAPELLQAAGHISGAGSQKVSTQQNNSKIDLSEVSLDKLLESRAPSKIIQKQIVTNNSNDNEIKQDSNFDRLFNDIYSSSKISQINKENQKQEEEVIEKNKEQIEEKLEESKDKKFKTKLDYVNEINFLKQELSKVVKDQTYKDKEAEILSRINELFQELKILDMKEKEAHPPQNQQQIVNAQGQSVAPGQVVAGIVVTKSDKALDQAKIIWHNEQTAQTFEIITDSQGRFLTPIRIPTGNYDVAIQKDNLKFHTYKIVVGDKKLPAYKFREK